MMNILFDKTVAVYRLSDDEAESPGESPADTESYAAHLSGVACNIQPVDDSYREDFSGAYIKEFLMFCGACDIKEKDRIIDGTDEYVVNGVKTYSLMGHSHMELRIAMTQ